MKKIQILFILLILGVQLNAQNLFNRTYGGGSYDEGVHGLETTDGFFILSTVSSSGPGLTAIHLMKLDTAGEIIWEKHYGGEKINRAAYMTYSASGNELFILSYSNSFNDENDYDIYLLKTDLNGDTLWTKTFEWEDWDIPIKIKTLNDSNLVICGGTYSFGNNQEAFIFKIDNDGDSLWLKTYGDINNDMFKGIGEQSNGDLIVAGYKENANAYKQAWVLKTNSNGIGIDSISIGENDKHDYFTDLKVYTGDFIALSGSTTSYGAGGQDVLAVRLRPDLNIYFEYYHGDIEDDYANSVDIQLSGDVVYAGLSESYGIGNGDAYIIYYQFNFFNFAPTFGGTERDITNNITSLSDNTFLAVGTTESFDPGLSAIYVLKIDRVSIDNNVIINDEKKVLENNINVYPNPTTNQFSVDFFSNNNMGKINVRIYDFIGNLVLDEEYSNIQNEKLLIQSEAWKSGIYMLQIQSKDQIIYQSKIIKN